MIFISLPVFSLLHSIVFIIMFLMESIINNSNERSKAEKASDN